jgi:serine/threonine protein phosphatase PrpC
MPAKPATHIPFCAVSDAGRTRSNNEDRYRADARLGFFMVVDGVGGQVAGEVASECVAVSVHKFIQETFDDTSKTWPFGIDPSLSTAGNRLRVGTLIANHALAHRIADDEDLQGMAATMSAVLIDNSRASVANVGDCRTYLLRDGELTQMTTDHSLVAEQVRLGLLDPHAARTHPMRNIVTRALSGDDELAIDVIEFEVKSDDTLLLCSDGLNSMIEDDAIRQCLLDGLPDTTKCCHMLVRAANDAGGKDNITVCVVHLPNLAADLQKAS